MKKFILAALAALVLAFPLTTSAGGSITVKVKNLSSESKTLTVTDKVCNEKVFRGTVSGYDVVSVSLCTSDAGYGSIKVKADGYSENNYSLLSDGEEVSY